MESKSLKLYLGSFRNVGEFHESCVARIAKDLITLLEPSTLFVRGEFTPRGGIPFWPQFTYLAPHETGQAPEPAGETLNFDPVNGTNHLDVLKMFQEDPNTDAVIMIGEIGGPDEAEAARWCKANMKKPIVGFIAGVTAPAGKRMGHAGALISGGADTADAKLAVMEECGFKVTRNPSEMARLLKAML